MRKERRLAITRKHRGFLNVEFLTEGEFWGIKYIEYFDITMNKLCIWRENK